MKRFNWVVFSIFLITVIALVVNLSEPYAIDTKLSVPFTNQTIPVKYSFPGLSPATYLGPLGSSADFSLRKGLDLEGGTSITLQADMKDIPEAQRDNALNSAKSVIERRINFFGVSEPVVQTAKVNDDYRIIVEIPGVTDVKQAVDLVGKTAKLTFWEAGEASDQVLTATEAAKLATSSAMPLGILQLLGPSAKQTDLTGSDLKSAAVGFNTSNGQPQVELQFTGEGAKKFGDITKRNVGKVVAIALDDTVIEAPRVNEPIYGGSAVITGTFTTEQANAVQVQLNAGALPVSLEVLEQHAIGATLGASSLQSSLVAGLIGFLVIIVFMVVLYGRLGVVASIALIIYTLIVMMIFRLVPVTLTLAGIAGFILSIGMAVDANILIFERMKEELRRGRTQTRAVELGFSRAWLSIRDSNVASLITSTILFYFGTGIVRGFALTLAIGILVSMFSAIVVTRNLLKLFYKGGK